MVLICHLPNTITIIFISIPIYYRFINGIKLRWPTSATHKYISNTQIYLKTNKYI